MHKSEISNAFESSDQEETKAWFRELTELPAAPGFEDPIRAAMRRKLSGLNVDWLTDRLGGLYAITNPNTNDHDELKNAISPMPRVLVCGHMDEVGFMVTQITNYGMIRFQPLGGWSTSVLPAQRLEVITPKGPLLGVVASTPPHLLDEASKHKSPSMDQLLLDVGASSSDEVIALGIRPGQSIVPVGPFTELAGGKRWLAKAWDNRYGTGLAMETMQWYLKHRSSMRLPIELICGATVQEEVGLRGAAAAARLVDPEICFVLDASPANDAFGGTQANGQLGGGVLIRIIDRTMITSPRFINWMISVAERHNIKYQFYTSPGGTDAGMIHQSGIGIPTAVIGICARYIHSSASIIDPQDYFAARTLLQHLIAELSLERIAWLQGQTDIEPQTEPAAEADGESR